MGKIPKKVSEQIRMRRLAEIISALRSRIWLSPVAADEMNRRDRYLADALTQCLPVALKSKEHAAAASVAARGGHARRDALTPERRREISRKAAQARWNKNKK
jgi:hypothetical protein